jgi:sugar-phosphatase
MTTHLPTTVPALTPTDLPDRGFAAFLFDMDGTILSSIAAAERVWARWAQRHRLDVAAFLPTIHGMRSVETVRRLNLPGVDAEAESAAITREEMDDVAGIEAIAGVRIAGPSSPRRRASWRCAASPPPAFPCRRC